VFNYAKKNLTGDQKYVLVFIKKNVYVWRANVEPKYNQNKIKYHQNKIKMYV
jgi:hypothetical protein